jgi:hypothetical protein
MSFIRLEEIMSKQEPFPGYLYVFSQKFLCRESTMQLYFPTNDRKSTERLSFSTKLQMEKIMTRVELFPQSALSIEL